MSSMAICSPCCRLCRGMMAGVARPSGCGMATLPSLRLRRPSATGFALPALLLAAAADGGGGMGGCAARSLYGMWAAETWARPGMREEMVVREEGVRVGRCSCFSARQCVHSSTSLLPLLSSSRLVRAVHGCRGWMSDAEVASLCLLRYHSRS